MGKANNNINISIFRTDGVTVHKEEDVLITCKGNPMLVGVQDKQGRYRIPLVQQHNNLKPHKASKDIAKVLQQANSV